MYTVWLLFRKSYTKKEDWEAIHKHKLWNSILFYILYDLEAPGATKLLEISGQFLCLYKEITTAFYPGNLFNQKYILAHEKSLLYC